MSFQELSTKLEELEETRQVALQELDAIEHRPALLQDLERGTTALLKTYAGAVPQRLDDLSPEDRNCIYKMLRLQRILRPGEPVELSGSVVVGARVRETENARFSLYSKNHVTPI